ncbi:RING FINGER PROTEIN [Salix purpurea]|uniref:RING FINGER PROTEIN n=1 Tax=Salix purpurea TaxID=77065 RepID=A0A9Q0SQ63_SALPP|nr:RING FINGER PROTEIN [Salix purpurea]
MELEISSPKSSPAVDSEQINKETDKDQVRVTRKTLTVVLEQCQRALALLENTDSVDDDDEGDTSGAEYKQAESSPSRDSSSTSLGDREADELCDLLRSRVECPEFLEKLVSAQQSVSQKITEDGSSWDIVSKNDLWEGENDGSDQEDYVLVRQEDIVEGIACFMAAYLLSLKQTKDLAPAQLQEALSKTFSVRKKKGKLRKAWDGSKVIYNVASWGATAIGLYQNPILFRVASKAFWTSCHVISKFV